MNKILVDTSVWIDGINGAKNKYSILLKKLIEENKSVVICPLIIQEILQGIKDDGHFEEVKDVLSGFETLIIDPVEAAHGAAILYRDLRKKGITIRKSNDCLIAFYAIHHNTQLLHSDIDFKHMAQHSPLKILKV